MKCSMMLHFIWVFTVCKITCLGILPNFQRVNKSCLTFDVNINLNKLEGFNFVPIFSNIWVQDYSGDPGIKRINFYIYPGIFPRTFIFSVMDISWTFNLLCFIH